jgi:formamidopyrimidine-DNA glycosylase
VPELPEVEVLIQSLAPLLKNRTVRAVLVRRPKVLAPTSTRQLTRALTGGRFLALSRRGKYLLFTLQSPVQPAPLLLLGHLGMTGRMYLQPAGSPLPKHAAVVLALGREDLVFEDTRYFGRLTLDTGAIEQLGPEPLGTEFTAEYFARALQRSSQPVKVKLLDQGLVVGIGNIYASEALFRARISPQLPARRLKPEQITRPSPGAAPSGWTSPEPAGAIGSSITAARLGQATSVQNGCGSMIGQAGLAPAVGR